MQQRNELIDESDLSRENLRPGFGDREPAGSVDFRKLPRLSRFWRPFDGEPITVKLRRVAIRLDCPCLDDFAAGLLDRVEAPKFAVDIETGLLEEFTFRGFERLLAVGDFSLRYGP